jgi:hypothetical protein
MAAERVVQESNVIFTDTQDVPQWANEAYGAAPSYPAQTRTYTVATKNWDMTGGSIYNGTARAQGADTTGQGYAATQKSWTRTEYHN